MDRTIHHKTSYIFSTPYYFLSDSQIIDYQLGKYYVTIPQKQIKNGSSINQNSSRSIQTKNIDKFFWALQQLEKKLPNINSIFIIFSMLFEPKQKNNLNQIRNSARSKQKITDYNEIQIDQKAIQYVLSKDTLLIAINALKNLMNKCEQQKQNSPIQQQMSIKGLLNIIYLLIYPTWKNVQKQIKSNPKDKKLTPQTQQKLKELKKLFIQTEMDQLLMKSIGLSLQIHYMPMKKVIMLYTIVLTTLFYYQKQPQIQYYDPQNQFDLNLLRHKRKQQSQQRQLIYSDAELRKIPYQNQLTQTYLIDNAKQIAYKRCNPIEKYYKKHNVGQCPLAQFVVVGLLRSLLTICNGHTHKKTGIKVPKGTGVDAYRQWQISYLYSVQNFTQISKCLPQFLIKKIQAYKQFNQTSGKSLQSQQSTQTQTFYMYKQLFNEFYTHKIYSTTTVSDFFIFLLISFKKNLFIQYSYFLQLITDANGILVFLKFLTDKFQFLNQDSKKQQDKNKFTSNLVIFARNQHLKFVDEVMLTIYVVLSMLFASCNNYPEKIRNYLFQYNSYLIIKKIPRLFIPNKEPIGQQKSQKINQKQIQSPSKKKKLQKQIDSNQLLPSRQDVEQIHFGILPQLTQLCFDLLKIQIPFFSKKANKQNSNIMRMVIDVYCRYPKKVKSIKRTQFEKILLKNKVVNKQFKYISSVQEVKNVHNQFNNEHYWANDFLNEDDNDDYQQGNRRSYNSNSLSKIPNKKITQKQSNSRQNNKIDLNIDTQKWLQQNVWRYYD